MDRRLKGGATPEHIERLKALKKKEPEDRVSPSDLPTWVKLALIKHELYGLTWEEAAGEFGRSGKTLNMYGRTPIGQKIRSDVREFRDNPVEVAKALLSANALGITLDRLRFLEWAKRAGDYAAGDKIAADLQDRIGITKKDPKGAVGAMQITLNIAGGTATFEPIAVETAHEKVVEADFEVDE